MKRILVFLVCFPLVTGITFGQEKQSDELLSNAIYQEEVKGNLEGAILIYKDIIKKYPEQRAIAAEALFHLGLSNEKLGNKIAKEYYEQVVSNYGDQPEFVRIARERLARLIQIAEKISKVPLEPKFTKINIPTKLSWYIKLSPDGKELAVVSDKKLWKLPLSGNLGPGFSGTPVQLNTEGIKVDHQAGLSWSYDGKWIAFHEFPLNDTLLQKKGFQSIYVVTAEGGKPTKVSEKYDKGRIENFWISLSPDGKNLAHSSFKNKEQHIYTTPVAGGSPKQLVDIQAREPAFSSDGKWIAYVEDKNFGTGGGNLWIVPAAGGIPKLIAKAGYATSPVWSPDNSMIAFVDDDKKTQINVVEIPKEGKEIGNVISIAAPEGTEKVSLLAGWSTDNKIAAMITKKVENAIYSLPVNGGMATEVLHDCWSMMPRWSPDGSRIYYATSENKGSQRAFQLRLASVPAKGGSAKFLEKDNEGKKVWQLGNQGGNRISPDGKTIVSSAWQEMIPDINFPLVNIWKITTDGSKSEKITNKKGHYADFSPSWSPDGNKIAFIRAKLKRTTSSLLDTVNITTINSSGSEEKILATVSDKFILSLVWSPDGKMLAYLSKENKAPHTNQINFINAENGTSIFRWEVPSADTDIELAWAPNSRRIAFNDGERKVIKIMTVNNGNIEDIKTNLGDVKIGHIDWSPDGEKFVFAGSKGGEAEFWFLENFLPLEKLAQEKEVLPKTTTLQKVVSGETTIMWGAVSPNEKFLTYSDPVSLNLAYRDLSNGKSKLLTNDAQEEPIQFNMGSVVSPDSKQIAYAWYKNNHEIRLVDINNPQPKTLYANKDEDVWPCAWSSDGKTIYARSILNKEGKCRLLAVDAKSGDMQVIKTFDHIFWLQLDVSPDNRYIAYHYPNVNNGETSDTDIHLISTDGKNESKLFEHPANDQILAWLPDKNQLLFKSDRSGSWDAWAAEVINGKVEGNPKKVLSEIGEKATSMGITNKGTYYYSQIVRKFNAFTVPFDQTNGEVKIESAKPLLGSVSDVKWSPDGKSLAMIKELWVQNKRPLYARDAETGNERMLSDNFNIQHLLWLQDNKTLLILGNDERRKSEKNYSGGMYTINVQTGEIAEVLAFSDYRGKDWEIGLTVAQMLAKGNNVQKNIYYLKNGQLISRELATGQEKILLKDPSLNSNNYTLDPLPDEKNILYCNEDQIYIIPVSGGKQIPIMKRTTTNSGPTVPNNAVCSTDGNYIYYTQNIDNGSVLWQITSDGKNPKEVYHSKVPICSLSIHPNGQKIVMTTLDQGAEIWKVDNLLSNEETADK